MARYILRPRPPLRAFALAAFGSLLGGALIVFARDRGWPWQAVLVGALLLVLSIGLICAAVASTHSMRVMVDLDTDGYWVHGYGIDRRGSWHTVARVTTADGGAHLIFEHEDGERTHLWCPMGAGDSQMIGLTRDIAEHLDRAHGYRHLIA